MPIQSGWANNSGIELFTIGWVVPPDIPQTALCLPWIGEAWLDRCADQHYSLGWLCCGEVLAVVEDGGGRQFVVFRQITEPLEHQIPVDREVLYYTQETETEFIIDNKRYELVAQRTPAEILDQTPNLEGILTDAALKMGVSRRKAKKELYNQIIQTLNMNEQLKYSLFSDDEEIIMILVATDEV
jgi:hypothetical protein